jgi:hypothetical protein
VKFYDFIDSTGSCSDANGWRTMGGYAKNQRGVRREMQGRAPISWRLGMTLGYPAMGAPMGAIFGKNLPKKGKKVSKKWMPKIGNP